VRRKLNLAQQRLEGLKVVGSKPTRRTSTFLWQGAVVPIRDLTAPFYFYKMFIMSYQKGLIIMNVIIIPNTREAFLYK